MKKFLLRLLVPLLVGVAILCWWKSQTPRLPVHLSHQSILIDGVPREYRLVVPNEWHSAISSGTDSNARIPVVFALHGALDTTDQMAEYTDLDELCAKEAFILVYLQGRLLNWPPFIPEENPTLMDPDLDFFRKMCQIVQTDWQADPNRIYVVGVSQGGAMANVVTAKCSEHIAASVCNCGWLPDPLGESPLNTQNKCPMLFISGTHDQQIFPSFVRFAHDAFRRDGHPTTFHSIEGAGHGWGKQHGVNEIVWSFLSKHERHSP